MAVFIGLTTASVASESDGPQNLDAGLPREHFWQRVEQRFDEATLRGRREVERLEQLVRLKIYNHAVADVRVIVAQLQRAGARQAVETLLPIAVGHVRAPALPNYLEHIG
ncbi:hypothetical protein VSR68_40925 [Paraburkholderia phymatum]|uniref:hypothetical protein n=1 Tax=Paraburkholderia TaxID=1822464 RepID=UPI00317F793A